MLSRAVCLRQSELRSPGNKNCTDPKSPAAGYHGGRSRRCEPSVRYRWAICEPGYRSQSTNSAVGKETFSVLVGPKLNNRQFVRAIATASIARTQLVNTAPGAFSGTWDIIDVDADWDDESEQVELRIEAQVSCSGSNLSASINGFAFHVTILAALPAG